MAWNSNSYEKPNAWDDSKVYKADRLLEDLQVYRIITGQVNAEDYSAILEKMGWDTSKLSKLTDDEKMGLIAKVLNEDRKENEYYASLKSKKRKRNLDEISPEQLKKDLHKLHESEKNRKVQEEKKLLKKEVESMQNAASSNPLILDFPLPGKDTIPSTTDPISIFHRPIESGISNEEEKEEEEKEEEEKEEKKESKDEESEEEDSIIQFSKDAPNAPILGPFCCICGKYGQYICDLTNEDVCSIECKKKSEALYHTQHPSIESEVPFQPEEKDMISSTAIESHEYQPKKRRYKDAVTLLDSHKCPLCGKTGHLPQDCYLAEGKYIEMNASQSSYIYGESLSKEEKDKLHKLYHKCKLIQENPSSCCSECGCRHNLVYCVFCNNCFCDQYHLLHHLQQFPSHTQLYSFKLRKLLKCSNPHCSNTNIYELYMCHKCSNTMHEKYYNMKTAIWRREALHQIPNLICCEEHSTWHIMNCEGTEGLVPIIDKECIRNGYYAKEGIINDMLF